MGLKRLAAVGLVATGVGAGSGYGAYEIGEHVPVNGSAQQREWSRQDNSAQTVFYVIIGEFVLTAGYLQRQPKTAAAPNWISTENTGAAPPQPTADPEPPVTEA